MSLLRIERIPVGVANLGLFGFDHLQLVLQNTVYDPGYTQDGWYVIEGVFNGDGTLGVEGGNGQTTLSDANAGKTGSDLVWTIGTPASRGSTVLGVSDPLSTWSLMSSMARQIDAMALPYIALGIPFTVTPTINSTSVIASLLYYAGLDITQSWPSGTRFSPGWTTLIGTRASDNLALTQSFTTLLGGEGNDTLSGSSDDRTDRLYGGVGNDTFMWSTGTNYLHGGQPRLDYARDGVDTVDYSGVGSVVITGNPDAIPNRTPNFIAEHDGSVDYLYSIERILWATNSDHVAVRNGAQLLHEGLQLDLGGQASAGQGDVLDFSGDGGGIVAVASASGDALVVKAAATATDDAGLWVTSAEWLVGSDGNDSVYAATGLTGIEGGAGNDLLDGRSAAMFSGASPAGYDIELDGGAGDDTLIANGGRTLLHGGAGADTYVISAMSGSSGPEEITIDDADASDRLYVPYNFFSQGFGAGGGLDGSQLMPLLGGLGTYADMQAGIDSFFEWRTQSQIWHSTDITSGIINFFGDISYALDGADLLIRLDLAGIELSGGVPVLALDTASETLVRVKNFQEGELGLTFFDLGAATVVQEPGVGSVWSFSNWDTAVHALTNDGNFAAPLATAPAAAATNPVDDQITRDASPPVTGTDGDDTITVTSAAVIDGGAGNDSITGSVAADIIDGGTGADTMAGGGGNDTYVVDDVADTVIETAGGGWDTVQASVDTALSDNVESLDLAGSAIVGTGNGLANRIGGNDLDNALYGLGGDDLLSGGGGNDTLDGGIGNDSYGYALGDGNDTVVDGAIAGETSTLVLTGIAPAAVALLRLQSAPDDLVLRFGDGGTLTLAGYFSAADVGMVDVKFDDGTRWLSADFTARAAAAPVVAELTPIAIDDPYLVAAQDHLVIPAATLLANDISPTGRGLTIVAVTSAGGGTVTLRADGDLDFAAPTDGGETTFTYTVSDGVATASAQATIGLDLDHAPTVTAPLGDAAATAGTAFSIALPHTLFTDVDYDPLTVTAALSDGSALPAWLTFDAASWTFAGTPPASSGDSALDIVLTASDGLLDVTTPLHIAIAGNGVVNRPPVATDDTFAMLQHGSLVLDAVTLLANDSDPDGDPLSVTGLGQPAHGSLVATGGGSWLYTPDAAFSGLDTLTYTIDDGHGHTASAAVAITVTPYTPGIAVNGNNSANVLTGTAGDDTITGAGGNDTMSGLAGNDTFIVAGQTNGYDVFDGGTGSDTILGSAGDDLIGLANAAGNLSGIEVIDGGAGSDTLRGSGSADLIDLSAITVTGIELIDGGGGADTIVGSAGNDTISGGSGLNTLYGGAGNDTFLAAGAGASFYDGGAGFDRLLGTSGDDVMALSGASGNLAGIELIDGGGGNDTLRGTGGSDLIDLSAIQIAGIALIDGGGGADTIVGSAGSDTISGGSGLNTLYGGAGDDTFLATGAGASFYDGGDGFDRLLGSVGDDTIMLSGASGNLAGIELIDGGGGNDTLRGTGGSDLIDLSAVQLAGIALIDGGGGADTIIGSAGSDVISGGTGLNALLGGAGDDTFLTAGAGASFYDGGDGFDVILGTTGDDLISLANAAGNLAGIERIDGGGGNDTIRGSASGDTLDFSGIALAGIARIEGVGGNDTITGSAGDDVLAGGGGSDVFVMSAGGGHDTIADFKVGSTSVPLVDVIDVSAWGFTSLADVLAHTSTNAAGHAVISRDAATDVTLVGVAPVQLKADDFRFG